MHHKLIHNLLLLLLCSCLDANGCGDLDIIPRDKDFHYIPSQASWVLMSGSPIDPTKNLFTTSHAVSIISADQFDKTIQENENHGANDIKLFGYKPKKKPFKPNCETMKIGNTTEIRKCRVTQYTTCYIYQRSISCVEASIWED